MLAMKNKLRVNIISEVLRMKLNEIMTTNVISVDQNETVKKAAELMKQHGIGAVPVCMDDQKVIGILTDRDIVLRSIAVGKDVNSLTVKDIMTLNPVTATPEIDVHEAARIMSVKQVRRLPVVSNDRLVGIVSLGDISVEPKLSDNAEQALKNISQPSSSQFAQ
jgi:CBS domain-containing protein